MWHSHFKELLNSSVDRTGKAHVINTIQNHSDHYTRRFTPNDIAEILPQLKLRKSSGNDGIAGEHLRYAHDKITFYLSMLFNAMLIHGYMPQDLMDTILIPIVKDRKGVITDKNNYRPVAITSIISKILELLILKCYKSVFNTTSNQFGFKEKLGTDMCVFTLKHIIDYYKSLSSPVYVAFLDASKAFDKVNHYHLLNKLITRKLPILIVRLLHYWYSHQHFMVQWGSYKSESFTVNNGVRQGGILSPACFNVFMDELSVLLNESVFGCSVNNCKANHLFYADDSILLSPSPRSLQSLLCICENYAKTYELSFNVKKTKVMCFKPKILSKLHVPKFILNGLEVEVVSSHVYLGVILDDNYCDDRDLLRQSRAIYARGNVLLKKFSICDINVKIKLFKAYCTSFYCSQLWTCFTGVSYKKLKVAYNNILRLLFKLPRDCRISAKCMELHVDPFEVLLRKSVYGFRCRLLASDNLLLNAICNSIIVV